MDALIDFFLRNLGLTKDQQQLFIRTAWVLFVTGHILWVCGWLTFLSLNPPFAFANDLKEIATQLRQDRIERLEHDILTTRVSQCRATVEEARRQYEERLQELISHYIRLAGQQPRVPACDEV